MVYIFWKAYQNHGDWEYVSIMAFFLGVFWMKDRSLIDKFIEKNYFVFLVSFSVLMYVFRHYEVIMKNIGITNKYVYYGIVGNLCTMIFVVYFLMSLDQSLITWYTQRTKQSLYDLLSRKINISCLLLYGNR